MVSQYANIFMNHCQQRFKVAAAPTLCPLSKRSSVTSGYDVIKMLLLL